VTDSETTIHEAKGLVKEFCTQRDWDQFHNPKDLAIGIATESGELLEIFRFKDPGQCADILRDPGTREHVEDELADVFYFVLRFAQMNGIDLSEALARKLGKNGEKYPVESFRGSNRKYSE